MSSLDPTVDEVFTRIWDGTREVHRTRGMSIRDYDSIHIVVSNELYGLILTEAGRVAKYRNVVQVDYAPISASEPIDYNVRLFGVPLKPSRDLEPHEVRFRVEVPV